MGLDYAFLDPKVAKQVMLGMLTQERVKYLKNVLESKTVPDRCYSDIPEGISGNRKLAIGCVFCPHKRECWSDVNNGKGLRAFKYEKGTTYLTHVAKEPRVQEIINW